MCNGSRVIRCGGCRSLGVLHATRRSSWGPSSTLTLVLHATLFHPLGKKMEVLLLSETFITQGIPSLTGDLWSTTFLGNLVRDRTCEACFVLILLGADFSIENPLSSLIWETPLMISLLCRARAFMCDFDLCLRSSQQEANTCDGHSPASAEGSVQTLPRTELYTSTRSVERESL